MESNNSKPSKPSKYDELIAKVDPQILQDWKSIQDGLKGKLIETDDHTWTVNTNPSTDLKIIGGMDISASKQYPNYAVSGLVICDKDLHILYEKYELVQITEPYVPGFLAFREVKHLISLYNDLLTLHPEYKPEVILVDGNGILHSNRFGLASHLGVLADVPTIGCGKTVFSVDGITKKNVRAITDKFTKGGEYKKLVGTSGAIWGAALRSTDDSKIPMIISVGHKVTLDTAIEVVKHTTKHRVPEPIRLADKITRIIIAEYERRKFKPFVIEDWLQKNHDSLYSTLED